MPFEFDGFNPKQNPIKALIDRLIKLCIIKHI